MSDGSRRRSRSLEVAAAEPGGLDRLMAGDTIEAGAVAAHLAGCPDCTTTRPAPTDGGLVRRPSSVRPPSLRRTPPSRRERVVTAEDPDLPPDLRERTLAYVRELGVPPPAVAAGRAAATSSPSR